MKTKKYKAGKLFNKFLKITIGNYMKLLFDYRMENREVGDIKPPFVIIANHTNFWDPFLLSMCFPDPVYFVTSDAYFRNPVLKLLLKFVGAIPKTKNISDPSSIRGILEVIKSNGIVCIFPEGKRNWDGKTLPLLHPTAKLIKSLKLPVISVLFKGACLSMPRWSETTRKGKVIMSLSQVLEPQDIMRLSAEEIYAAISESLAYDEYEYQRKQMNPYHGRDRAKKLELFLFCCPECGNFGNLESSGNQLRCSNCSYDVVYNTFGFFENDKGKIYFDNPRDWNSWQLEELDSLISSKINAGNNIPIFSDKNITTKTGQKTGALKIEATGGTLALYTDRMDFMIEKRVVQSHPFGDIIGENVQFNNQLEFINNSTLYRYSDQDGNLSAYKWVMAIGSVKKHGTGSVSHAAEQTTT